MIFVDPADGSKDLAPLLRDRRLPVTLQKLDYADVEFVGRGVGGVSVLIGIECKRLSELTSDYDRFAGHQVPKMLSIYDHRWMIYEGEWRTAKDGRLQRRAGAHTYRPYHGQSMRAVVRKRLITMEMCGGMHTQETTSRAETVGFIEDLYRWWTDENFDEHRSHIVLYEPQGIIPLTDAQRAFASWPGLGLVKGKAVAQYFKGSIRKAVLASADEWAAIEVLGEDKKPRRLGTKVAARIQEFLKGARR